MATYKTGDSAPHTGDYHWKGMENDENMEAPSDTMQTLHLSEGDPFPPVQGEDGKGVWESAK